MTSHHLTSPVLLQGAMLGHGTILCKVDEITRGWASWEHSRARGLLWRKPRGHLLLHGWPPGGSDSHIGMSHASLVHRGHAWSLKNARK